VGLLVPMIGNMIQEKRREVCVCVCVRLRRFFSFFFLWIDATVDATVDSSEKEFCKRLSIELTAE
jgi:hypothetical protein